MLLIIQFLSISSSCFFYVYNDVHIFHIDLMQNNNFQTVLPKAQEEEVKERGLAGCYWSSSQVIDPSPSSQPRQIFSNSFHALGFQVKFHLKKEFHY